MKFVKTFHTKCEVYSFILFLEHDKNTTKKFAATYCMYKTDLTRGRDKHNMSINMTPETGITTEQNNTEQMHMNNRLHLSQVKYEL